MRVTNEAVVARSLERLDRRMRAYDRAQDAMSTGRRYATASEDPGSARKAMRLRSAIRAVEQYVRNAQDAGRQLAATDQQLQSAHHRLQRVREIALSAVKPADPAQRDAWAAEIDAITQELAAIANSDDGGRRLFAGYSAEAPVSFDEATGQWSVAGEDGEILRRVGDDEVVRTNVTAAEWLGVGSDSALNILEGLSATIRAGGGESLNGAVADLDASMQTIANQLGIVGANAARAQAAHTRADVTFAQLRADLSNLEDVDLAHGIMELETQQLSYEVALQALAKSLPPSLANFLR